ncbi:MULTISPECIES: hypothetical protein [unclassified Crossiella]|uniref:hypothetical protein n=1 Tax=unclassified Crossiella TaxID=2620835 RepID=UPI001FFE8776|nr:MULTISPECIES: hypothetical protein [unclassified Crossiella]MCK2240534.1 hypothetical protein [Crossiella sp. S99.2]MCK2253015.1 hypothetical protein [Crossiella sp. S99.1]
MRTRDLPTYYRTWTAQDDGGTSTGQLERTPAGEFLLRLGCTRQYEFTLTPEDTRTLAAALRAATAVTLGPLSVAPAPQGVTLTATVSTSTGPTQTWPLHLSPQQCADLAGHLTAITSADTQL